MSNANHIVFIVYSGYVAFRDTEQRTGSMPITDTANKAIASIKESLGIDALSWTSEVLQATNVPAPTTYEKAVGIAMGNYLSSWDGTPVEAFDRLQEEEAESFFDIDYAEVWRPFENDSIDDVVGYMDTLISDIVRAFGK